MLLLLASYSFYFYIGKWAILILFLSTVINYGTGILLSSDATRHKRCLLSIGIFLNILLLVFFKYFASLLNPDSLLILLLRSDEAKIIFPLGLSFYTLQNISYLIDTSKGLLPAERNLGIYATFLAFFPKIIAGPIERGKDLLFQLREPEIYKREDIIEGGRLIFFGLFKKLVIADRLTFFINEVFRTPGTYKGVTVIVGLIFLSFQIYLDFSGYTNIAIGIAKILGIRLTENFKRPYLALNIVDFWNRWHLSFSTWLRDYIYYPVRRWLLRKKANYSNVLALIIPPVITMVISGLWHGTGLTFLIWGLYHAFFYTINSVNKNRTGKTRRVPNGISNAFSILINFGVLTMGWLIFRSDSLQNAWLMFRTIFVKSTTLELILRNTFYMDYLISVVLIIAVILSEVLTEYKPDKFRFNQLPDWGRWLIYGFLVISITVFGVFQIGGNPFIYGQF
jgi:alginate O-acetyltransferase complex protein AlgI